MASCIYYKFKSYKDFSTTLLIVVHKQISAGHFVCAYWVGDGGIGIYRRGKEVKLLGKGDSGEYAGQTRFLDQSMIKPEEIMSRIRFTIVPDFTAIIAMTDGITDPWFETEASLGKLDKWDNLWNQIAPHLKQEESPEKALMDWLDFKITGNHDDRTIAVLYAQALDTTEKCDNGDDIQPPSLGVVTEDPTMTIRDFEDSDAGSRNNSHE